MKQMPCHMETQNSLVKKGMRCFRFAAWLPQLAFTWKWENLPMMGKCKQDDPRSPHGTTDT
jgi:hypothetical protein